MSGWKTTKGEDIFRVGDKDVKEFKVEWRNCIGISSDGAKKMPGCRCGFVSPVRRVVPTVRVVHCLLHREALASKALQQDLADVEGFIHGSTWSQTTFFAKKISIDVHSLLSVAVCERLSRPFLN